MKKKSKKVTMQKNAATEISQAEDRALKLSAQYFGTEMLQLFDVEGNIKEVFATELNYVEFQRLFQDFNYLMEDDSCCHFEFESDRIKKEDLRRFRAYEAVTSYTYHKPVITNVVCSATVKEPLCSLKEGINEYRVNMIRLKDGDADEVFRQMKEKETADVTKKDLLQVVLTPLMSGETKMKERISTGFHLLRKEYPSVTAEESKKMQAVLYLFALKFLGRKEVKEMGEIRMTYFAEMMQEEGRKEGRKANLIKLIKKKIQNGKALDIIADEVEETVETICPVYDLIRENIDKSEKELLKLCSSAWARE